MGKTNEHGVFKTIDNIHGVLNMLIKSMVTIGQKGKEVDWVTVL